MGLLSWLFGPRQSQFIAEIHGNGKFSEDVVGESHYQDALDEIAGGKAENGYELRCKATLILEDSNQYDRMAVRVDINGMTVGYLPKQLARRYRKQLAESGYPDAVGECDAMIVGGWDRGSDDFGHYGVKLDLIG